MFSSGFMLGSRSVHGSSRSSASSSRSLEGPFTLGSRSVHGSNFGPLTIHMPCVRGGSGPGFPMVK